jgi:hypothetical protein
VVEYGNREKADFLRHQPGVMLHVGLPARPRDEHGAASKTRSKLAWTCNPLDDSPEHPRGRPSRYDDRSPLNREIFDPGGDVLCCTGVVRNDDTLRENVGGIQAKHSRRHRGRLHPPRRGFV